jgi:hypothetical protein
LTLCKLAVAQTFQGHGLGDKLLLVAGRWCWHVSKQGGGAAMLIDVKNKEIANWYASYGALPFPAKPLTPAMPFFTIGASRLRDSSSTVSQIGPRRLRLVARSGACPFGVRVHVVAPGLTLTDATAWLPEKQKSTIGEMTPLRRVALPEQIVGMVLAVASDHSRFENACYIPLSGGLLML